jgi:DNA-directed RNA polymerase I, II, and III subunit RPABC1
MDLSQFRQLYANQMGSVECVRFCSRSLWEILTVLVPLVPSRNQLNFFTAANEDPSDQIFVFFTDERSVGVKTMRK